MKMTHAQHMLLLGLAGAAVALGALPGCRGQREDSPPRQFFPDLDDQPKWKPQTGSDFYTDGRAMRQPVAGTVPFGRSTTLSDQPWAAGLNAERGHWVGGDEATSRGTAGFDAEQKPVYISTIPAGITVDAAMLKRGQDRYNIYCTACHGYTGDGRGMVAAYYQPQVVNLHDATFFDPKNVRSQDGWLFRTIREGKPKDGGGFTMPPYGHALGEQDAWAVVAYVRALQESRRGTIGDVPEAQRDRLMRDRPPAPVTPAKPGGAP